MPYQKSLFHHHPKAIKLSMKDVVERLRFLALSVSKDGASRDEVSRDIIALARQIEDEN